MQAPRHVNLSWRYLLALTLLLTAFACEDVVQERPHIVYDDVPLPDTIDPPDFGFCGNGIVEGGENCDGGNLNGETCTSLGLGDGNLSCSSVCNYDTADCEVQAVCPADDFYENNDNPFDATPVPPGESLNGVYCGGDDDWFALDMFGGEEVRVDLLFDRADGNLTVALLDPGQNLLAFGEATPEGDFLFFTLPNQQGRYYLLVTSEDLDASIPWRLEVDFEGGVVPGCPEDDIFEENDFFEEAVPFVNPEGLDAVVCMREDGSIDEDWYSIRAPAGVAITIELLFDGSRGDLDLQLVNPFGTVVASSTGVSDTENISYQVTPGEEGLYSVGVYFDSNTYHLDISLQEPGQCGNGVRDAGEQCDGFDVGGESCETLGFPPGQLRCQVDCQGFDVNSCFAPPTCGNGLIDAGEVCDNFDLGGASCESIGFPPGQLRCAVDCNGYDILGCNGMMGFCGNNIIDAGEACDGFDTAGLQCQSFGFFGGVLGCLPGCFDFDFSGCRNDSCGDGIANLNEACDGMDLRGATCQSLGFAGGNLGCNFDCGDYDISACLGSGLTCPADDVYEENDRRMQATVVMNGSVLDAIVCVNDDDWYRVDLGPGETLNATVLHQYALGDVDVELRDRMNNVLAGGYSTTNNEFVSAMVPPGRYWVRVYGFGGAQNTYTLDLGTPTSVCGDNLIEGGEVCDGFDLAGLTCQDFGAMGGMLGCFPDCSDFDTSQCGFGFCGNGFLEPPNELCDGNDFGGQTCLDFGFIGGSLTCTPNCQGIDTSACVFGP